MQDGVAAPSKSRAEIPQRGWARQRHTFKTMTTPTTMQELRAVLCETIAAVRAKEITPDAAEAINNASGKIVASFRVELEYRRMRGEVPQLAFMDGAK